MEACGPGQHQVSDPEDRDLLLPTGRSVSLVDLQDAQSPRGSVGLQPHNKALAHLSRTGSQTSIGRAPPVPNYPHSNPVTPQPVSHQARALPRDSQPQSAPQVRRPLHPSLSQQRNLQPLSFQNPVYHLSNPAHSQSAHSSSENLSTESSHNSHSNSDDFGSQAGVKGCTVSNSCPDQRGSSQSTQSEECLTPGRHVLPDLPLGAATAVAIPRQGTTAGTAHIIKVEQQSRGGGGARVLRSTPQSASLCSSSSVNTEPTRTTGHAPRQQATCSIENIAASLRSVTKQPQKVWHKQEVSKSVQEFYLQYNWLRSLQP